MNGEYTGSPTVSVVVPAYNAERTIGACLLSVLGQTFTALEVIVVDDGSEDSTVAAVEHISHGDARVRLLRVANGGVSAARNRAIGEARGEFLFFLDADDTLRTDALALLVAAQRKSGAPVVIGGFDRCNPAPMRSIDSVVFAGDRMLGMADITFYVFKYLSAPNRHPLFVSCWGRLILADVVRRNGLRFDEAMRTMEDVLFNFRVLSCVESVFYVAQPLYNYRVYMAIDSQTTRALVHPDGLLGFAPALEGIATFLEGRCEDHDWIARWIGHAYVNYTIIHMVRLCLQWHAGNTAAIYRRAKRLLGAPRLAASLDAYAPARGDSWLLPILFRRRQALLSMVVCKLKAWLRYGRSPSRPQQSVGTPIPDRDSA